MSKVKKFSEYAVNEMQSHELEFVEFVMPESVVQGEKAVYKENLPELIQQVKRHLGISENPIDIVGINRDHGQQEKIFFDEVLLNGTIVKNFKAIPDTNGIQHMYKVITYKGIVYCVDPEVGFVFRRRINGDS